MKVATLLKNGIHGIVFTDFIVNCQLFSSHPYLFFNQDGYTMTFLGFWVDEDGNLLDYNRKQVIEQNFMDKRLRTALYQNGVSFQEDYKSWDKYIDMLHSIHPAIFF